MVQVISNELIAPNIYIMKVRCGIAVRAGQFFMLRAWRDYPLLSRPISIHDAVPEEGWISFMYRVIGEGTRLLTALRSNDTLQLEGPLGNGFPEPEGRIALVGGGIGIAPLLLAARRYPGSHAYLGYSTQPFRMEAFEAAASQTIVATGESIVAVIDPAMYDTVFACGPAAMLRALTEKRQATDPQLYVSIETRMACGIGACYVCSLRASGVNRKACLDGPVFAAEEVDWDALDNM